MPTVSRQQQKLMKGIATGSIPPGRGKPSKAVAQKFSAADSARGPKKLPPRVGAATSSSGGPPAPQMSSTAAMGSQLPPAQATRKPPGLY